MGKLSHALQTTRLKRIIATLLHVSLKTLNDLLDEHMIESYGRSIHQVVQQTSCQL